MAVKYFSIHRPIAPGTYPKAESDVIEIMNFSRATHCNEIGRTAWGYIIFADKISDKAVRQYELMEEGKVFYKIMCMFREGKNKFTSPVADYVPGKDAVKPDDEVIDHGKDKIIIKWFESAEDANIYINNNKK